MRNQPATAQPMEQQPLLPQEEAPDAQEEQHDGERQGNGRCPSVLTLTGFAFLTFNSGMALYRSNGDLGAISFVLFSFLDLVLLFYCLRLYEDTKADEPRRRGQLKAAVWLLTTMLTGAFSYKVAAMMPLPVQVLVWAMAGATVFGGFWAFFVHSESKI